MAYNANTDYQAIKDNLQKQIDAETDATKKAALQSQYDAAEQGRLEKTASDINKYGKYVDNNELDQAAGIAANNQIGNDYEVQKQNLNKLYDTAKQNANNDALSRGMARSSYVSDRLSNLDSERANALSDIDAAKAKAVQAAKTTILNNYTTNAANALKDEKDEYNNNIKAYYDNYQQEIDNIANDGDTSNDWKIPYLKAARNAKLLSEYGTTDPEQIAIIKQTQALKDQYSLAQAQDAVNGTSGRGGGTSSSSRSYSGRRSGGSGGSGNGGDNGDGGGGTSADTSAYYTSLDNQLSHVLDKGYNSTTINRMANLIAQYLSKGLISQAQAATLQNKYI